MSRTSIKTLSLKKKAQIGVFGNIRRVVQARRRRRDKEKWNPTPEPRRRVREEGEQEADTVQGLE